MADNITVIIGADTSALRAALAQAQATLQQFAAASQTMSGATSSAMGQVGATTTAGMNTAKTAVNDMIDRLDAWKVAQADMINRLSAWQGATDSAYSGLNNVSTATDKAAHASTGFYRELIVLGHEMSQGNFSRFGGSMLVLAERMGNLESIVQALISPMGLLSVAVVGLGAAFIAVAAHASRAEQALKHFQDSAAMGGHFVDTGAIDTLKTKLDDLPNSSKKMTAEMLSDMAKMRNGSVDLWSVMADLVPAATVRFDDAAKAVKAMATAFDDPLKKGEEFLRQMGATDQELSKFGEVLESDSRNQSMVAMADILHDVAVRAQTASKEVVDNKVKWDGLAIGIEAGNAAMLGIEPNMGKIAEKMDDLTKKASGLAQIDATKNLKALFEDVNQKPDAPHSTDFVKEQVASDRLRMESEGKTNREILQAEVGRWRDQVALAKGNHSLLTQAQKEETTAELALTKQTATDEIAAAQNKIRGLQGTSLQRLQGEKLILTELSKDEKLSGDQREKFAAEATQKTRQIEEQASRDAIKAVELKNSQISANETLSSNQRVAAEAANLKALLNSGKVVADQRAAVEQQYNAKISQLRNLNVSEALAAARAATEEARRGSDERVAAARHELDLINQYHMGQTTAGIEAGKRLIEALKQQQDLWLADYGKGLQEQLAAVRRNETAKIAIIRGALSELGAANLQYSDLFKHLKVEETNAVQAAQEQQIRNAATWNTSKLSLEKGAFDQKRSLLDLEVSENKRTESQKYAALRDFENQAYQLERSDLVRQMADDNASVQDKLKSYIEIEKLDQQHLTRMQQMETQNFQQSKANYLQYTSAIGGSFANAIQGMILRTTTLRQAIANILTDMLSLFLNAIMQMVANWAAGELAKLFTTQETSATIATVRSSTAMEGAAAQSVADAESITSSAATGAAGAYSSAAAIPFVGWMIAPAIAAAALVAIMAFKGNLAVGAWEIPQDMTADIHKGEMVVPATFAEGLRRSISGGGTGGQGQSSGQGSAPAPLIQTLTAFKQAAPPTNVPAMPSYAVGSWNIPSDTQANLHAGEMVIPASFAEGLRQAINGGGGKDGAKTSSGLGGQAGQGGVKSGSQSVAALTESVQRAVGGAGGLSGQSAIAVGGSLATQAQGSDTTGKQGNVGKQGGPAQSPVMQTLQAFKQAVPPTASPAMPSFEIGTWSVPANMPANLHKGEMVVPKSFADGIRSGQKALGGTTTNTSGGDTYQITIHALDSRSVKQIFDEHSGSLVQALAKQRRNLNQGLR